MKSEKQNEPKPSVLMSLRWTTFLYSLEEFSQAITVVSFMTQIIQGAHPISSSKRYIVELDREDRIYAQAYAGAGTEAQAYELDWRGLHALMVD